jgi:hypothetical protein
MRGQVMGSAEREKRKESLTESINNALDSGNYFIVIASFDEDKMHTVSEWCWTHEKMSALSELNKRVLVEQIVGDMLGKFSSKGVKKR